MTPTHRFRVRRSPLAACTLILAGLLASLASGCESGLRAAPESSVALPSSARSASAHAAATATDGAPPAASTNASPPPDSVATAPARDVRMPTEWLADLEWNATQRLAHAKRQKQEVVDRLFADAGVAFPPHELLLRTFKQEAELEVWAGDKDAPMKLVATYGVCAASGGLGPKRNEGNRQVPEGYYKVGYYHPMSSYYLSAQVNYPNASDRARGGPSPGSDILIHGRCASIGCISMTDERIEEIYLVGWAAFMNGRTTHIHIFPSRRMDLLLADPEHVEHHAFWREIAPGFDAFERTRRLPSVTIARDGRYLIAPAAEAIP